MTVPKRIQMSRQKPWRADNPDAVIVARPSRWGNPFRVSKQPCAEIGERGWCWVVWRDYANYMHFDTKREAIAEAVDMFRARPFLHSEVAELRGKDLACWCPLDQPCHADVLLELANA